MLLQKFPSGPFQTSAYVIGCKKTKLAAVIDPGMGSTHPVLGLCHKEGYSLKQIFLTHSHWDHMADAAKLKNQYGCQIWIHSLDAPNLEKPGTDGLPLLYDIQGVKPDHLIKDKDVLHVGDLRFQVIHTPGHSPGSCCFYMEKEKLLFSGDTLFMGTMGNISFPSSDPEKMWASLKRLSLLPWDTRVLPGHGPDTILENEQWITKAKEIYGGM